MDSCKPNPPSQKVVWFGIMTHQKEYTELCDWDKIKDYDQIDKDKVSE